MCPLFTLCIEFQPETFTVSINSSLFHTRNFPDYLLIWLMPLKKTVKKDIVKNKPEIIKYDFMEKKYKGNIDLISQ